MRENLRFINHGIIFISIFMLYLLLNGCSPANRRPEDMCAAYSAQDPFQLGAAEGEDLVVRKAQCSLAQEQPHEALRVLGDYLRALHRDPVQVAPETALTLAAAYKGAGDPDQALAWYSQAYSSETTEQNRAAAERGAREVIASLSEDQFSVIAQKWVASPFVGRLFTDMKNAHSASAMPEAPISPIQETTLQNGIVSPDSASAPTSVAAILPLSGKYQKMGASIKKGFELAAVQTQVIDGGSDPLTVSQKIKEAANELPSAQVLIGPLMSESVAELAELARSKGVPLLSLAKSESGNSAVVELGITARSQVETILKAAVKEHSLSKIGIVYPRTTQGGEFVAAFRDILGKFGLTPACELSFEKDITTDFPQLAVQAEGTEGLEAIFFADKLANASYFFSLISEKIRSTLLPLGIASWSNRTELKNAQNALNNAIFVAPFFSESERPQTKSFVEQYKGKFNDTPDVLAAQGFDIAQLVSAAGSLQSKNGGAFLQSLSAVTPFEGVTGNIQISPTGEVNRDYPVIQFSDGIMKEK
jgi:branched-chain amino acid transport system substrate-binding protein